MSKWKLVPVEPIDEQAHGLAKDIAIWWGDVNPTGRRLHRELKTLGHAIPEWLPPLIADGEAFPLWSSVACAIYRAMLDAAPIPVADDCDGILDCYAAENQQFSDEIVQLRAEVESARTKAIALESRRDAWRDSAILSQRSASGLAQQVDQQAAELARLRTALEQIELEANQPFIQRIAAEALRGE